MIRQDRYIRLLDGQTEIAKKVHHSIPDDHSVTLKQIYSEIRKSNGGSREVSVIEGCVNTLVSAGLVRESPAGRFKRVVPRANVVKNEPVGTPKLGDILTLAGAIKENFADTTVVAEPAKPHAIEYFGASDPKRSGTTPPPPATMSLPEAPQGTDLTTVPDMYRRLRALSRHVGDDLGIALMEMADGFEELTERTYIQAPAYFDDLLVRLASQRTVITVTDDANAWDPRPVILPEKVTVPKGITIRARAKSRDCGVDLEGINQSPEYRRWTTFSTPSKQAYSASKGLTIDQRWVTSFRDFLNDVGYRPEFGAVLMRVDESKGYYGWNFRWRKDGKTLPKCLTAPEGWPFMEYMDALAVVRMNNLG